MADLTALLALIRAQQSRWTAMTIRHDNPVEVLERWSLFGARWRVLELSDRHAVVELRACTGEPVDRLESDDPALIGYLRSVDSEGN